MFKLDGKKALVTGASGGIGKAIATALHKQGAHVVLSGRRKEALEQVKSELGNERAEVVVCDLSDKVQVANLIGESENICGQIDILVCNAGITKDNLSLRMKEDEWHSVINTNLSSTFVLNSSAIKKMMKRRFGRIINISSVVGSTGNAGQANYAASKAGIGGMSKSLAAEVAMRGITVNCIAPGFIKTAMTDALNDSQKEKIISTIPSGTFGIPEDVAVAAAFLSSDEAKYITGQTIHVNGGMLMT